MTTALELDGLLARYPGGTTVGPISLAVAEGEMVSLLGPSGCGKTTVLRMIAGFVAPGGGVIRLRGNDVTHAPAHRRGVGLVFQNFALFPHLTVAGNIAFGPRRHGVARAEVARRVARLVGQMRLEGLEGRLPSALSGGQQQRVAIARALAIEPAVVLLDEPFSSLDTKLRESTRMELRVLQQELGFTAILVTHDQSEALAISDRVAVMQAGRLEQVGTAPEIYYRPSSRFVANFIGRANAVPGGVVRPESVRVLSTEAAEGVAGRVISAAFLGDRSEIVVDVGTAEPMVAMADGDAPVRFPPGTAVRLAWPDEAIIRLGETT